MCIYLSLYYYNFLSTICIYISLCIYLLCVIVSNMSLTPLSLLQLYGNSPPTPMRLPHIRSTSTRHCRDQPPFQESNRLNITLTRLDYTRHPELPSFLLIIICIFIFLYFRGRPPTGEPSSGLRLARVIHTIQCNEGGPGAGSF